MLVPATRSLTDEPFQAAVDLGQQALQSGVTVYHYPLCKQTTSCEWAWLIICCRCRTISLKITWQLKPTIDTRTWPV